MQEPQETWVWSLGWEDALEEEMATHFSVLAWRIPWTEEPSRQQSIVCSWTQLKWLSRHTCMPRTGGVKTENHTPQKGNTAWRRWSLQPLVYAVVPKLWSLESCGPTELSEGSGGPWERGAIITWLLFLYHLLEVSSDHRGSREK